MATLAWKPWHEVVRLRDDLRSGELPLHLFAADLYEVIMQRGKRPVYEQPDQFFALTFPTYNLRQLVRDVVLRLAGKNDKAVRQLELTYGGGKTHTLITLYHLAHAPDSLPDLPAVAEFEQAIGQKPPRCRVAGLCFDKLDVEKGVEVKGPDGAVRVLRQPWSVLAYQLCGDDGLRLLHADGKAEERESAPAENVLTELFEMPVKQGMGVLILIDEVLMYAREKVAQDKESRGRLVNFFQYLTQAATKVDRCCVVASLLASDPRKGDTLGRELQGELYDVFQREREEAIEPVLKEDVAEVLRRRFFTPDSIKDREAFRQHVVAALKGIMAVDEQTSKQGATAEERFLRSYPFHPDLTEVFYGKWTNLDRFQRTRGVLRTFALALREAEGWDRSPLVGPEVFLSALTKDGVKEGLSEALRELVTVADTEEVEGKKQAWTGILDGELARARQLQEESTGLKNRELEQAVAATFLHSQPIGQSAKLQDLMVLLGAARPDKIDLEKGLGRWAATSHWLDDLHAATGDGKVPATWRLGNRPNLTQMHSAAARNVADETVRARLLDEVDKTKGLITGASGAGVRVHALPAKPKDVEDDGAFHYVILGPSAASESGKPSPEAKRFLDEKTGPENPRVFRNAILALAPSRDGLELALGKVRDYLAWEIVREELKKQSKDGNIDPARAQTLTVNAEKARSHIAAAIRQAWCIVVTVSDKDEVQAFKLTVTDDAHFSLIKADKRSRVQETAITAEALLPGGPYNLWKPGDTFRRVKDLAGAFAQLPHLPKMLKASTILETLAKGGEQGAFVLRLVRPDGSFRTWWRSRPDEAALSDPALELVLPAEAVLSDVSEKLLLPGALPKLWNAKELSVEEVLEYFGGGMVVQIDHGGYVEPVAIPRAEDTTVNAAVAEAVKKGLLWLTAPPASILAEEIPAGILTPTARLQAPPDPIGAPEILPEVLPNAWKDGKCSALSVNAALSANQGKTLPWKTVVDVIDAAIRGRFLNVADDSGAWPCDLAAAAKTAFVVPKEKPIIVTKVTTKTAAADLEPSELQDLADVIPKLADIRAKTQVPFKVHVTITIGDGTTAPAPDVAQQYQALLTAVKEKLELG